MLLVALAGEEEEVLVNSGPKNGLRRPGAELKQVWTPLQQHKIFQVFLCQLLKASVTRMALCIITK